MTDYQYYFEGLKNEILSEFNINQEAIRGASESEILLAETKFNTNLPSCYVDWLRVFGANVIDIIDNTAGNFTLQDFIFANTKLIEIRKEFNLPLEINDWTMIGIYIEGYVLTGFISQNNSDEIGLFHVPNTIDSYDETFVPFIRSHLINSILESRAFNIMFYKNEIPKNGKWAWQLAQYKKILNNSHSMFEILQKTNHHIKQIEMQLDKYLSIQEVVCHKYEYAKILRGIE